jgi:hypothetical protein
MLFGYLASWGQFRLGLTTNFECRVANSAKIADMHLLSLPGIHVQVIICGMNIAYK